MSLFEFYQKLPGPGRRWLALVTAFFAALTAGNVAWPIIEPWALAHRGYVREFNSGQVTKLLGRIEPLRVGQINQQISAITARRNAIEDRQMTLEIEIARADDQEEKIRKQFQVRKLQDEATDLDVQIKRLLQERDKP